MSKVIRKWKEALEKTFEHWKEKIQIVNKYAGAKNSKTNIDLKNIPGIDQVIAIKMDIEGAESEVLHSAGSLLKQSVRKLAITTYHK